jgi:hypothetical protein
MPLLYANTTLTYEGVTKGPTCLSLIKQYQKYIPGMPFEKVFRNPIRLNMKILRDYKGQRNQSRENQSPKANDVPLLNIPSKIRVNIYNLVFNGAILSIDDFQPGQTKMITASSARGEIVHICKSIYSEAMPVLHHQTTLIYCGGAKGILQLISSQHTENSSHDCIFATTSVAEYPFPCRHCAAIRFSKF